MLGYESKTKTARRGGAAHQIEADLLGRLPRRVRARPFARWGMRLLINVAVAAPLLVWWVSAGNSIPVPPLDGAGRADVVFTLWAACAVSVGSAVALTRRIADQKAWLEVGEAVVGTVVDARERDRGKSSAEFKLTFRYALRSGDLVSRDLLVDQETYDRTYIGDQATVIRDFWSGARVYSQFSLVEIV